ncbi:phosphoribosylglycinamide formyltransferase [Psychrobacter sp. I-STPA6b]|uniref:phosphoribosylglycinamide formyltransferase n=1 Tax=Psychrobacter sp. I-STPA6b TaxID=2585718 RepID=UPI001D0C1124|nr:phosphoribosylglycinamide formyltransferase [Psychrobacter sp. I-STPA6b]
MSQSVTTPAYFAQQNNAASTSPLKVAVLVSGNGSNLQVLIDAMQAKKLPIDIVGVISNKEDAYAITRAQQAGIATAIFSHIQSGEKAGKCMGIRTFERHALKQLQTWQPDLIVLAGFMRVLGAEFIASIPAPMINLHPSLLPNYKGLDTHQRVLNAGERYHGCSVHVVTAELDAGTVLTQAVVEIASSENSKSLQAKVQKQEHILLPWTIQLIASGILPYSILVPSSSEQTKADSHTNANSAIYTPPLPLQFFG